MLIFVVDAEDDEDEQEAMHISFLTICTGYPLLYLMSACSEVLMYGFE